MFRLKAVFENEYFDYAMDVTKARSRLVLLCDRTLFVILAMAVAEKLAQELSAPNENLESLIAGLKKEVESVRHVHIHKKIATSQVLI